MRIRGDVFWQWADPTLHHRTHDETLDDGTFIDVQVRLSPMGHTQMFLECMHRAEWLCMKRRLIPDQVNQ